MPIHTSLVTFLYILHIHIGTHRKDWSLFIFFRICKVAATSTSKSFELSFNTSR